MHSRKSYARSKYKKSKKGIKFGLKETYIVNITAICILILVFFLMKDFTFSKNKKVNISNENISAFQIPQKTMKELEFLSKKYAIDYAELLSVYSLENNFFPTETTAPTLEELEQNFIRNYDAIREEYSDSILKTYYELFNNILTEIENFPIPENYDNDTAQSYMYGDSWNTEKFRDLEANSFQGTDIFDRENTPGRIPIVSITMGVVENIGWSDANGYIIEIKSSKGGKYYYSHLDNFTNGLNKGSTIESGQVIGFMGNSGFGEKSGKKISTQVYLHLGIKPNSTLGNHKLFINPYPFLGIIEDNKVEITGEKR